MLDLIGGMLGNPIDDGPPSAYQQRLHSQVSEASSETADLPLPLWGD